MVYLPPRLTTTAARVAVAAATAVTTTTAAAAAITTAAKASAGGSTAVATTAAAEAAAAARAVSTETTAAITTTTATAETTALAEIGVAATATTATATTTAATSTAEGRLTSNGLEEAGNLLVGLLEKLEELADDTTVATVEESSSNTGVASTAGTTDTMNVVINVGGEIVVDNVGDVGNIQTTGSNSSGNQDRALAIAEKLEGTLTLTLGTITVNRGGGEVLVDQEIRKGVGHALGLNKDKGETTGVGVKDIKKDGALVNILNVLDLLGDVL